VRIAVHVLGTDSGNGAFYLFYSGLFTVLCVVGGQLWNGYLNARKNNCHVRGCWRIGRRVVPGTDWHACNRHHPDKPPSHEHLISMHRIHLARGKR